MCLEQAGFGDIEISTSTSPDGFAMSEYYRKYGCAPQDMPRRIVAAAGGIVTSPLVSVLTADGDMLHASCRMVP